MDGVSTEHGRWSFHGKAARRSIWSMYILVESQLKTITTLNSIEDDAGSFFQRGSEQTLAMMQDRLA